MDTNSSEDDNDGDDLKPELCTKCWQALSNGPINKTAQGHEHASCPALPVSICEHTTVRSGDPNYLAKKSHELAESPTLYAQYPNRRVAITREQFEKFKDDLKVPVRPYDAIP